MKTATATIVETWPVNTYRRAVALPEARYFICNNDHPEFRIGDTVTVQYDPADQFATIIPAQFPGLPAPPPPLTEAIAELEALAGAGEGLTQAQLLRILRLLHESQP